MEKRRLRNDMDTQKKVPELLAPAGDMEALQSAVRFGADAVYLAGTRFGMRAAPANFTPEQLREAVKFAHANGVRVYLTCNTLPRNEELDGENVDRMVRAVFPPTPLTTRRARKRVRSSFVEKPNRVHASSRMDS